MSVDRLRALQGGLTGGEVIAPELARWFCAAVSRCDGERGALEDALGLPAGWSRRLALQARNDCIRRIRAAHFADLSLYAAAKAIATAGARYQASAWRRIQTGGAPRPGDALGALFAEALATGEPWPRERRIRDILAGLDTAPR